MMYGTKASASGLFEIWGGFLIEGDCVTPSVIKMFLIDTYPTSEALNLALETVTEPLEYSEVRLPKNYLARLTELNRRKRARELAKFDDSVPF